MMEWNILFYFEIEALGMRVRLKIEAKFAHFLTPCKNRGELVEMSAIIFHAAPGF